MILEITLILSTTTLLGGAYSYHVWKSHTKKRSQTLGQDLILLKLQPKVSWCRYLEYVGDYGIHLSNQYKTIMKLHQSSLQILSQKFNVHELTYGRYQQTIDATHHLLIDNVVKIIPLLETLDNIVASELNNQQDLVKKIEDLSAMNDQLLERLNDLIVNLSQVKSLSGPDEKSTQFILENLDKIIENAKYY